MKHKELVNSVGRSVDGTPYNYEHAGFKVYNNQRRDFNKMLAKLDEYRNKMTGVGCAVTVVSLDDKVKFKEILQAVERGVITSDQGLRKLNSLFNEFFDTMHLDKT